MDSQTIKTAVRERYAGFVSRNESCCGPATSCGCVPDPGAASLGLGYGAQDLEAVPEGANLGLGCGNPVALASLKPGETVLDLGSGAGFDAFLASRRVGPTGRVIGVDMTPQMIERATTLAATHGYANVEFRLGEIEALPLADASVDVVISNCVVNLSTDKARTFREAYRVLKPGGRLMVSDLVLARPLPEALGQDLDAYGACVAGALLKPDYLKAIEAAGFIGLAVAGERRYGLDMFSPELLEAARKRHPDLSPQEMEAAAGAVLSLQIEATKSPGPAVAPPPAAEVEDMDLESKSCACGAPTHAPDGGFWKSGGWLLAALPAWFALYLSLKPLGDWLAFRALGLQPGSRLGEAVAFFAYDGPKVLLLLGLVVLGVSFVQTFISAERTRDLLAKRTGAWSNLLAALLGIATPFCSCSAVPLFIGFVRVGVPLGATFSFLVSAPMVNEVALFLLLSLFGWKIALLYTATGVAVAFVSGWVLGKLRLEGHLEPWVMAVPFTPADAGSGPAGWSARLELALQATKDIVGKVWPFILAGIAVGAFLHGYAPAELMARFMGKSAWWSVPLAVLIGVPLYANAAGIIPIVQVLLAKGAALGTALAFMMAVTGLSLPETVILRKVLKPRLLGVFLGVVALGIVLVGFLFNAIL